MTEQFHFHFSFSLSCIGEGNGNPLQCSCLENPRDGGDWWAAIYGVAQSRIRLKQLSSRSSSMMLLREIKKWVRRRVAVLRCELSRGHLSETGRCEGGPGDGYLGGNNSPE